MGWIVQDKNTCCSFRGLLCPPWAPVLTYTHPHADTHIYTQFKNNKNDFLAV